MAQFVFVITDTTTEQYLKVVEVVEKSGGTVRLRPEAVGQGAQNGYGVATNSMSSATGGGKTGFLNIRIEWSESGAKHGAEIAKLFEPKATPAAQ
jgi:hypothetical protein